LLADQCERRREIKDQWRGLFSLASKDAKGLVDTEAPDASINKGGLMESRR